MATQNDKKFENGGFALLGFRKTILDAGESGQWPGIIKTVAAKLGVEPSKDMVLRLTYEFWCALLELTDGSALVIDDADDFSRLDEDTDAKAYQRFYPLFEAYLAGRVQEAF